MGEYLGDKPSSRVLRPPGGQSSNIFGGPDTSPARNTNTKPTYQSSVFSSEPEPPRPQSGNRRSNMSSNIFGSEPVNNSSNVKSGPQKISKTHQSSVFQDPQPLSEEKRTAAPRHDPITGAAKNTASPKTPPAPAVVETPPPAAKVETKENVQSKPTNPVTPEVVKDNNPHLGAVKNTSGVRSIQPPGGKSSISFF